MKNTHELEDDLRERWLKSYPDDERKAFCFDGLCYNGEIYNDGKNAHQGNEEKLWNNTDRRILFLMKDTNNNSDSDYREWHWRNINHNFFNCIFKWLEGLSRISKDFIPTMENGDYAASWNRSSSWAVVQIRLFAHRYGDGLEAQIVFRQVDESLVAPVLTP